MLCGHSACDQQYATASHFICVSVQRRLTLVPCILLIQINMAEELSVFDVIAKLGVAGKPLEKHELREVAKLAEAAKAVLEEVARTLIASSQKRPVLFEY